MQMEIAQTFAVVGGTRAQDLYQIIQARKEDPTNEDFQFTMSDKDAAHWADLGFKMMRTLDQLPTEHIMVETPEMVKERVLRTAVTHVARSSRKTRQ